MINLEDYIQKLDEVNSEEGKQSKAYQEALFLEYVMRNTQFLDVRKQLKKEFEHGAMITGEKGLRKQLAAIDIEYFGKAYLSHYFLGRKTADFHRELDDIWIHGVMKNLNPVTDAKKISRMNGCRRAIEAPRGHAKSTTFTFKDTMHAALYVYKHYIIILSDSSDQAEGFLIDIKAELEDNTLIREDFGTLQGKIWTSSVILLRNGTKIEAIGSGKKIRGRRHGYWRPDLIVLDDVENDENVNTLEQRNKLESWFNKAVSKAGDTYTDIVYIGTLLHYDSLLAKVVKKANYHSVKYRGVISFATNQYLWDIWESIYNNLTNEQREEDGETFFEANQEEMLEGTKVLWEDKMDYYSLMIVKIAEGDAAFNSEIQNDPIDPKSAVFNEEWFDFYNETLVDFKDPRFIFFGANDPSLGKNKKADTSSILVLAKDTVTGYLYIVEASVEIRKADVIILDVIETSRRIKRDYKKGFTKFGVEVVQFQHFFKEVMAKESAQNNEYIPIEEINSLQNKRLRIESLQPLIKNGYIKFNAKHKALLQQLKEYPMGRNDDAPDGLEMVVKLALASTMGRKVDYKSVISRAMHFKKGAY